MPSKPELRVVDYGENLLLYGSRFKLHAVEKVKGKWVILVDEGPAVLEGESIQELKKNTKKYRAMIERAWLLPVIDRSSCKVAW